MAKINKKSRPEVEDEDDAPPVPKKKASKPEVEEDEDDAPPAKKKKSKAVEEDEDDDNPPFEADEDDDAPPKKKSKKAEPEDDDDAEEAEESEEEDDAPKKPKKKAVVEDDDAEEEEDDTPKKKQKLKAVDDDAEEEDDAPRKKPKEDDDEKPRKSFLSTGAEARALSKAEEGKAALRAERSGKMFQFRIPKEKVGEDYPITFLDGVLDDEGFLSGSPTYHQHTMKIAGRWTNFASPCKEETDPLIEAGIEPVYVQVFTIIDHRGYVDKDGKKHLYQKRLFVAKGKTQKQLLKIAQKRGGLKGCTFEASRTGPKDPNVGSNFEFVGKQKISEFRQELKDAGVFKEIKNAEERETKLTELVAIPKGFYDTQILQYSAKDIKRMGLLGQADAERPKSSKAKDLDEELDEE